MKYSAISFPSLGLEFDPPRTIELGEFSIHFYGIIIALGLVLAVAYCTRVRRRFGFMSDDTLMDGVLWVTPFAILCARAYYCIFQWEFYAKDPIRVFYIWEGGLAIYGGVLGAILGIFVFSKVKKLKVWMVLDLVSLGFLIGQSIGRWGNFFNREAFGAETESFLRMGLFNTYSNQWEYHHPTFLYESAWNAVGFVLLHLLSKRRRYDGQVALSYVAWYGLGRTLIEGLRTDSLYIPNTGIRVSQLLAAASCAAAVVALAYLAMKPHSPEDLFVNQIHSEQEGESDHE